jgi:hypothetical protein
MPRNLTLSEQMALLHNSLSGGPATVSDVNEVSSDEQGIHRFGPDDLILYALSGKTFFRISSGSRCRFFGPSFFYL